MTTPVLDALFDMDSTLCDFDKSLMTKMQEMAGPDEPPLHWDKENWPAHIKARSRSIKSQVGFWRNLPRLQAGFDILNITQSFGFNHTILTRGPKWHPAALTEKAEWCQEHVPGIDIALVRDKSKHYGKLLVDDWPEYFLPWLEVRPRGWVIAVQHAWNKDVNHPRLVKYDGSNLEEVFQCVQRIHYTAFSSRG